MKLLFAIFLVSSLSQVFADVKVSYNKKEHEGKRFSRITSAGKFDLIIAGVYYNNSVTCSFVKYKNSDSILKLDTCYRGDLLAREYFTFGIVKAWYKISSRHNVYINAIQGTVHVNGQVVGEADSFFVGGKKIVQNFTLDKANVFVDREKRVITID